MTHHPSTVPDTGPFDLDFEATNRRNVFVFGAGFSKSAAGLPVSSEFITRLLDARLPDKGVIVESISLLYPAWSETDVEDVREFACSIEIEDLFQMVESREDAVRLALRRPDLSGWHARNRGDETYLSRLHCVVARFLWEESISEEPSRALLDFLSRLTDRDAIITFNWDLVLERGLDALGLPWAYCPKKGLIYVCKLHGSVNWFARHLEPAVAAEEALKLHDVGCGITLVENIVGGSYLFDPDVPGVEGASFALGFVPAMLTFGSRKDISSPPFFRQWLGAHDCLRSAYRVVIAGYSLPQPDLAARHLMNGASVWQRAFTGRGSSRLRIVINPDAGARKRVQEVFANDCEQVSDDALAGLSRVVLDGPEKWY